ncbi:MAG: GNAT family N-acetyltransferase [Patescibacteria group bacterium]
MEGPRAITVDELPLIEELVNDVFRAPEGLPPILFSLFPRLFHESNIEHIRAVFVDRRPVAVVNYLLDRIVIGGCPILAASISTVATRVDYRNQGLSSLLLDDTFGLMRREKVRLVFVSGSRGLYRRMGCHPAGMVWVGRVRRHELPPAGQTALRLAGGMEAIPALHRLHAGEDPRFLRDESQFGLIHQAEPFARAFGYQSHTWLIVRGGEPVAYAIVAVPAADRTEGRVLEYAGDRKALAGALLPIGARLGLETMEIAVPYGEGDRQFLEHLRLAGGNWQAQTMPGTINLLDPAGLWSDLMPRFLRLMGETTAHRFALTLGEGETVNLHLGQEAVVIPDRERLVRLFFGAGGEKWPDRPLPAGLQRALSSCFPLPLPWLLGLNYL